MPASIRVQIGVMADEAQVLSHQEIARRGAVNRAKKLTADQRRDIAKRAAQARWGKKTEAPTPPDPNGPQGPNRDEQWAEAGIM